MWQKFIWTLPLLCVVFFMTSACGKRLETHGNIIKQDQLDRIKIGTHTRADISELLGSPSAIGTFNDKRWYYLTEKTAVKSLSREKVIEREIIVVNFDKQGIVSSLAFKTKDDAKAVNPSKKSTKTHGQTMGIIDQLIDNLGKGF